MSADVAMTDAPDEQMEETAELSQELKDWKLRLKREGKKTFGEWINKTRHANAELDPNAKLMPLIMEGLHKIPFEPIPLLSEDELKLFHIPPASPAEVAAAAGRSSSSAAAAAASAAAAAAGPSAGPATTAARPDAANDIRFAIWEVAHVVHESYTNHWPKDMARPKFAEDQTNPRVEEYGGYPGTLLGELVRVENQLKFTHGVLVKETLERWRDAPETTPRMKEALRRFVELLADFGKQQKQARITADRQSGVQQQLDRARQNLDLLDKEMKLAYKQLEQQFQPKLDALIIEAEGLKQARNADKVERYNDIGVNFVKNETGHWLPQVQIQWGQWHPLVRNQRGHWQPPVAWGIGEYMMMQNQYQTKQTELNKHYSDEFQKAQEAVDAGIKKMEELKKAQEQMRALAPESQLPVKRRRGP